MGSQPDEPVAVCLSDNCEASMNHVNSPAAGLSQPDMFDAEVRLKSEQMKIELDWGGESEDYEVAVRMYH